MEGIKAVAAYVRVSTIEQKKKGLGVKVQTHDVKEFAKRCGIVIHRIYKDEAESGMLEHRTQLKKEKTVASLRERQDRRPDHSVARPAFTRCTDCREPLLEIRPVGCPGAHRGYADV